ncbi:hypothetical protein ATZ36_10685 [Candidatus Endomicrobiellum trichonymphae]|uniref:ATP-cone domain-containing protein n=1 Tax=Endomicrobium trichonymphae TaxID=1408204 RepID=A0A1E5IGT9_ENDTX|nr:hypothetical protein ATZ36_10685 [Candidatus Endomicrobium trichonymphae]
MFLLRDKIKDRKLTVEKVQDAVEEVLLYSIHKRTAKAYILYRNQRSKIREIPSAFDIDLVDQYLKKQISRQMKTAICLTLYKVLIIMFLRKSAKFI